MIFVGCKGLSMVRAVQSWLGRTLNILLEVNVVLGVLGPIPESCHHWWKYLSLQGSKFGIIGQHIPS
jgi:hypothetical protein